MRAALSDASTMPDFPWWVTVLIAAVALYLLARPAWRREGKRIDHVLNSVRDTPAVWEPCAMNHCHAQAKVTRVSAGDLGMDALRVCPGCSDAGDVKGWWTA